MFWDDLLKQSRFLTYQDTEEAEMSLNFLQNALYCYLFMSYLNIQWFPYRLELR